VPHTLVTFHAHPDDEAIATAGVMAKAASEGHRVVLVVATRGEHAGFGHEMLEPGEKMSERRVQETQRAAEILGCELRVLMEGGCKRIEDAKNYQLVGMIDAVVKEFEPGAILTHGPTDFHRDHVAIYHATVPAQRLAQFDLYCYVPTMTRPVPVPFEPNAYVDISSTLDTKLKAIATHKSQFYSRGLAFEFYRDIARVNGRMVGVEYAEGLAISTESKAQSIAKAHAHVDRLLAPELLAA